MVLCKKNKASPLPEHFQTTSELIHNTHSLENESSGHDDTEEGGFKNFKFSEGFLLPNLRKQNKMEKGQNHGILFEKRSCYKLFKNIFCRLKNVSLFSDFSLTKVVIVYF